MKEENSEREGCNYKDKNCSCSKMFLGEEEIKSSTLKKKLHKKVLHVFSTSSSQSSSAKITWCIICL